MTSNSTPGYLFEEKKKRKKNRKKKKINTPMFITVLFTTANIWKQSVSINR